MAKTVSTQQVREMFLRHTDGLERPLSDHFWIQAAQKLAQAGRRVDRTGLYRKNCPLS